MPVADPPVPEPEPRVEDLRGARSGAGTRAGPGTCPQRRRHRAQQSGPATRHARSGWPRNRPARGPGGWRGRGLRKASARGAAAAPASQVDRPKYGQVLPEQVTGTRKGHPPHPPRNARPGSTGAQAQRPPAPRRVLDQVGVAQRLDRVHHPMPVGQDRVVRRADERTPGGAGGGDGLHMPGPGAALGREQVVIRADPNTDAAPRYRCCNSHAAPA